MKAAAEKVCSSLQYMTNSIMIRILIVKAIQRGYKTLLYRPQKCFYKPHRN